ncbi:MAG: NAD-dependent epimerase/dehydratase family protein [Gemmatimonadales bacterium]
MTSRREFLAGVAGAGVAAATAATAATAAGAVRTVAAQSRSLRILILGGTGFSGPHLVQRALERGHTVSTFSRGRTDPPVHAEAFDEVEQLIGDRATDLSALRNGTWDAVIDNSGFRESWTRESAELLRDRVGRYVYTSSTGVYYPYLGDDIREETAPVLEVPDGITEVQRIEYDYGVMKARSEIAAREIFGEDRTLVVRPTYIMGPGDPSDRVTYWPVRLARGGEVMLPGRVGDPVQYIDVRDLTAWMIRLIEEGAAGTFNAVGPASATGVHQFVHGVHAAFSTPVTFVPIDDYDFLTRERVLDAIPWIMPVGDNYGSARVSNRRALERGLELTPLADSMRDLYEWWLTDAVSDERREALTTAATSLMAREPAILAAWRVTRR